MKVIYRIDGIFILYSDEWEEVISTRCRKTALQMSEKCTEFYLECYKSWRVFIIKDDFYRLFDFNI